MVRRAWRVTLSTTPWQSSSSGGSWKSLFYFAAGGGRRRVSPGYVYLVPVFEDGARGRQQPVGDRRRAPGRRIGDRRARQAEGRRREVQASAAADKAATDAKRKTTLDALAMQLKPGLEALGAHAGRRAASLVGVSFPAAKLIDANGIDVSDAGTGGDQDPRRRRPRRRAPRCASARASSAAPPPKELRSLFRTAGEMNAVRAARVMSSLEHAGVAPARITIVGDVREGPAARAARGKKGARRRSGGSGRARDRARVDACAAAGAWRCSRSSPVSAAWRARRRPTTSPSTCARSGRATRCGASRADGSNELLSRRRLTQYMDLSVFDIAPARWRGDDGDRNVLYFDASLRFDSDFGGYMLGRPTGSDDIQRAEAEPARHPVRVPGRPERRRARRLPARAGRSTSIWSTSSPSTAATRSCTLTRNFARRGVRGDGGARRAAAVVADLRARRHQRRARAIRRRARRRTEMLRRWSARRSRAAATAGPLVGAARVPAGLVGDRGPAARRARLAASTTRSSSLTANAAWRNRALCSRAARASTCCWASSTTSSCWSSCARPRASG